MLSNRWQAKFLICSFVIWFVIENILASPRHHHKGDDDSEEDDDDGCYIGRNCRPGCYCTGHKKGGFCRPYFPPHSAYLQKYQCTGYNYPKWKIYKGGKKGDGRNSTVLVVIPHHYEQSEPYLSTFLKENNFTTFDNYQPPVPVTAQFLNESQLTSVPTLPNETYGSSGTVTELFNPTTISSP